MLADVVVGNGLRDDRKRLPARQTFGIVENASALR
jgi:hypothetical protein